MERRNYLDSFKVSDDYSTELSTESLENENTKLKFEPIKGNENFSKQSIFEFLKYLWLEKILSNLKTSSFNDFEFSIIFNNFLLVKELEDLEKFCKNINFNFSNYEITIYLEDKPIELLDLKIYYLKETQNIEIKPNALKSFFSIASQYILYISKSILRYNKLKIIYFQ